MVQKLLQENFFKEKPVIVMLCIPKNMNRFLEESVDDYKKAGTPSTYLKAGAFLGWVDGCI